MNILFDRKETAIIRLYDDWFVAYSEALHLGWLEGNAVFDRSGKCIGWYIDGILRDLSGRIVAKGTGSNYPNMAGVPGRPGRPGLSGTPGMAGFSSSWSKLNFREYFRCS